MTPRQILPAIFYVVLCVFSMASIASDSATIVDLSSKHESSLILLAQASAERAEEQDQLNGTVVIPASVEKEKSEKKCMTVCQRWGQECMYDNNRGRKCRRTCKEFGQECF